MPNFPSLMDRLIIGSWVVIGLLYADLKLRVLPRQHQQFMELAQQLDKIQKMTPTQIELAQKAAQDTLK